MDKPGRAPADSRRDRHGQGAGGEHGHEPPPAPYGRLGIISFGLALGVACAAYVFMLGLTATLFGWGVDLAQALSSIFIGYGPSFVGAIAGAVWAFVDGFVGGAMIAWLYNRFLHSRTR